MSRLFWEKVLIYKNMEGAKKIIGWVLVAVGLVIVFSTLYYTYNIFTGETEPIKIFKTPESEVSLEEQKGTPTTPEEMQKAMEQMVAKQISNMIPAEFLSKLLNIIAFSIFAGILILGGGKVASIGISMLK